MIIVGLGLLILEIILNDCVGPLIPNDETVWKNIFHIFCITIASIASIFLVSVIWDICEKRSFSNELLETIGMTKNVVDSGITDYMKNTSIDWATELVKTKKLELFLTFGDSWVDDGFCAPILKEFLSRKNTELIVVLPNYNNSDILNALLVKYPKDHNKKNSIEKLKNRLANNENDFRELLKEYGKSKGKVFLYDGIASSSYFFLDDKCYFSPYVHEKNNTDIYIPIILLQDRGQAGSFYNFCRKDMNMILDKLDKEEEGSSKEK